MSKNTISNIINIEPYKNGPDNEWFVTTEDDEKPLPLLTESAKPWRDAIISSIDVHTSVVEINGKYHSVYIADKINYKQSEKPDLNSLSPEELTAYVDELESRKALDHDAVSKWVQAIGYMSYNMSKEREKLAEDPTYKVKSTHSDNSTAEFVKSLASKADTKNQIPEPDRLLELGGLYLLSPVTTGTNSGQNFGGNASVVKSVMNPGNPIML